MNDTSIIVNIRQYKAHLNIGHRGR